MSPILPINSARNIGTMNKYDLVIFLKIQGKLLLIEELEGDREYLVNLGNERLKNNKDYFIILREFKLNKVNMIKEDDKCCNGGNATPTA